MKNQFLSKAVPRGTRTIWRYLSALILLFSLSIGQMWGAPSTKTYNFDDGVALATDWDVATTVPSGGTAECLITNSLSGAGFSAQDGNYIGLAYKNKSGITITITTTASYENISNITFKAVAGDNSKPTFAAYIVTSDGDVEVFAAIGSKDGFGTGGTNKWGSKSTDLATAKTGKLKIVTTASSSGKYAAIDDIVITYTPSGGGGDPEDPVDPTITFNDGAYTLGDAALDLSTLFSSNSDGAVTYSIKTDGGTSASISGTSFSASAAGTAIVTASQAAGTGYNAGSADANIVVSAAPAYKLYYYFSKAADATTAGVTNNEDGFFTVSASGSNGTTGSITLHGTTYNCTNRTSNATTLATFTIPANKKGDLYGLLMSSGSSARGLSLDGVATGVSCAGGTDALKNIEINNIPAGTHTLTADGNTRVGMFIMELTDGTYHTITLNLDGGTGATSVQALDGVAATKPADPTKDHCAFAGWYNGASPYDWSAAVTGDLALTAHWTQLYTISFAAGEGSGDAPAAIADKAEGETFEVPANTFTAPSASQEFDKWNDGTSDFAPGDTYTVGTANVVLTAQWKALVAKYTVIFKDGETTLDTKLVDVGSNPSDAGVDKTKPLFAFAAWQLSGSDIALDDASWASVAANAEVTLTARWNKLFATSYDMEAYAASAGASKEGIEAELTAANYAFGNIAGIDNGHTHNFIYDGVKWSNANDGHIEFNAQAGKLIILKTGYMKSNTAAKMYINGVEDATVIESANEATETHKLYYWYNDAEAKYKLSIGSKTAGGTCVLKAVTITDPYQVTFDDAGADDPVAPQYGYPSVTLPSATKGSESLVGWFDDATAGNKIGEPGDIYIPTADIMLYAHWESVSTDARLASITFSSAAGTLSPAFDPEVVNYTYTMPYPTAAVPTITGATSVSAKAKTPVIDAQAANWGDVAHIHGVAESDDTKDYYITMKIAPKDGVSIIKVATTGGTNKTVTGLYAGDGDVNLSSNTKMDNGKYIGFTLDGTTLQAGDQINVHTTQAANTSGSHIIFYDNMTDKNELYETGEIGGTGDNIFEINAAMIGATTAYVYRSNADAAHQWNGYVDFIEVTRAMNPVLTAIQFNSTDVAVTGTTVSALLPNGTNLGTMTVTPTIVWNGPGTAAVTGSWAWGANTYVVTDKDGDATTYTITLTEDVLKHTVSFNTHGGSAVASVEVEDGEKLAAAPADPEKDDYIFQGWAETADGAIVDVTSFTISADKEFHAVWAAETGVIKLLDGEGNVNTTDFITGVTAGTVNFDDEDHNCASFGSTGGDIIGKDGAGKFIVYNSKTTQTKIKFVLYNTNSSPKQITLQKLVEGADDTEDVVIDVPSQERFETPYYTFNNTANRTMYAWTNSTSVKVLQVKVVDDGTPVKQAGEVGYSLNLNLGRVFAPANMAVEYDGLAFEASSNYKVLNSTELQTKKNISFTVASPVTLVLESTGAKYQVSTDAAGSGDEYAAGTNEHDLTAGTWHIVPTTTSNMKFASISFTAPKCEKPAIVDMSDVDLCENDPYTALTVSASVSDGGTLHYAWFKEAGATDEPVGTDAASFTPDADGEYYVIVTNQKDGFADNTETSNVVTVQHLAGTTITTAPVSVRKDAGEAATLTVVAAGKNLAYEWFTCNADGTGAVAVDPAATEASLDVIVPDGEQYYKVVVTGDCGTVEAIAKVEKWVELTQQDVTATTFWDFSKNGVSANTTIPVTEEDPVKLLANIPGVNNNELFRSDNIVAGSGKLTTGYIQTQKLSFHATVPGYITVSFSNTGNKENYRYLVVNGVETSAGSKNGTVISYSCAVPAGDVELTVTEADGGKMFNFRSLKFEKMDYFREIRPGYYGTICLEHGGKMYGAALYEVAYFDGADKIFFDEIVDGTMVPGMPYIFLPEGDGKALAVAYSEEAPVAVALSKNGLYGSYEKAELDPDDGNYILLNNQYVFVNTTNVFVGANRAYIRLEEIGTTPFAPAPGRRRISMGVSGESQAQGFENLDASEKPMKVMIDGQMYILRGEKVFDATGRLVK